MVYFFMYNFQATHGKISYDILYNGLIKRNIIAQTLRTMPGVNTFHGKMPTLDYKQHVFNDDVMHNKDSKVMQLHKKSPHHSILCLKPSTILLIGIQSATSHLQYRREALNQQSIEVKNLLRKLSRECISMRGHLSCYYPSQTI